MAATFTCPTCGHVSRQQTSPGQETRCPSCLNVFPAKSPVPSILSRSIGGEPALPPGTSPNRTVMAQPETMIRYTCARCKKSLESPVSFAGQKINCPDCGQRLQIPPPSAPPPPPINKTILATEESAAPVPVHVPSPRPQPVPPTPILTARVSEEAPARAPAPSPARRESCLECGKDITERTRVQTCPDCGSLFCSAGCFREHDYHAHAKKAKKRRRDECHRCGSTARPHEISAISQAGWITFALLLVFFFPLFWIGLLITETQVVCPDCGARLD